MACIQIIYHSLITRTDFYHFYGHNDHFHRQIKNKYVYIFYRIQLQYLCVTYNTNTKIYINYNLICFKADLFILYFENVCWEIVDYA